MAKFVLKETDAGFHFNFLNCGGEIIGKSETYSTKEACVKGIESVRKAIETANLEDQTVEGFEKAVNPKFEMYIDKAGDYRFRLKARNGEIILSSGICKTKDACKECIDSILKCAPNASVE